MSRRSLGLLAVLAFLVVVVPAHATNVTLRVEGKAKTLVPQQSTTLLNAPFKPDGTNDCAANSYGSALQVATGGDWAAAHDPQFGYYLTTVRGEQPGGDDYFTIWRNHQPISTSVCSPDVQEGDDILIFVDYCTYDPAIGDCGNPPVLPLDVSAPQTVAPGTPFTVRVVEYGKDGKPSPEPGASVSGGDVPATTGADGNATVTLSAAGPAGLRVTKANRAADEATVCATTGADGACGSVTPGQGTPGACATSGDDGRCGTVDRRAPAGKITSIREGQRFAKGRGPRTLKGIVTPDPSGLAPVRLRLTRTQGRRCSTFDGKTERLLRMAHCGAARGRWFDAGDRESWSYLLPTRLPAGRYVLDVRAADQKGNADTQLQRTRNRVVFTVR